MSRRFFVLLFLLLSGCSSAPLPFAPHPVVPVRAGVDRAGLLAGDWRAGLPAGRWRQSALFEWHGRRLPMNGLLQFDRQGHSLQLLALNDLGLKLFLLRLDRTTQQLQLFQPALKGYAGLEDLLATALRRLLLQGPIPATARLQRQADGYLLQQSDEGRRAWFRFSGEPPLLTAYGEGNDWQVDFYQLQDHQGRLWPEGMVLQDHRRGYRLLVRNEEFMADER